MHFSFADSLQQLQEARPEREGINTGKTATRALHHLPSAQPTLLPAHWSQQPADSSIWEGSKGGLHLQTNTETWPCPGGRVGGTGLQTPPVKCACVTEKLRGWGTQR